MKGTVAVPTGIFVVTDGVEFEVRPRDAGILLWLTDRRVNRRYEIKIDETGIAPRKLARGGSDVMLKT
jgi:hypothetical protein